MKPIRLAILGATGMAGREAVLHQYCFDQKGGQYAILPCVTGSDANVGKKYGAVFREKEQALARNLPFWTSRDCPVQYGDMTVDPADPDVIAKKADFVISALDSGVAKVLEPELTQRGVHVFSNDSSYRWAKDIPLLVPEVNYHTALPMIRAQKTEGKHVCNTNCTIKGYVALLDALMRLSEIKEVTVVTQQSVSGKGDKIADPEYTNRILGNVIDDWSDDSGHNAEEWKSSCEPLRIFGYADTKEDAERIRRKWITGEDPGNAFPIHSHTTRVPVQFGHLENITIEFGESVSIYNLKKYLSEYEAPARAWTLPTTYKKMFVILDSMPEPKRDVYAGCGMAIVLGDFKQFSPNKVSLWSLTHNLRTGATWAGRQGLELYLQEFENFKF